MSQHPLVLFDVVVKMWRQESFEFRVTATAILFQGYYRALVLKRARK